MIDELRAQLPTLGELRAVKLAVGQRPVTDDWMQVDRRRDTEPDENLLEVMTGSFTSVSDVRTRLGSAEAYLRSRSDRRSVFLTVYAEMTATIETGIESGVFDDPDWVREYLIDFAD